MKTDILNIFFSFYHGEKIHTLIKMDEIANLGAVKIRLRSMLDAVKENNGKIKITGNTRKETNRIFMNKDRERVLIAPYFSPFYSPLLPSAFRPLGYKVEVLPPQDRSSVEFGLKNINNDMCYPAVLVAGDIIKAFQPGGYDPEKTAVILTQTGGQCRASAYVSLIKKGLFDAGLDEVPVIAISNKEINPQPGFEINEKGLFKRMAWELFLLIHWPGCTSPPWSGKRWREHQKTCMANTFLKWREA
ncbi:MAG: 2-hydroxyacyl-CoA dehydratase [Thermodesulfobacteriota bacterium]|nr:2-hydroxyacyl-CoA dehydratase [Thermodesulfobacteriota bacterium]